MDWEPEVLKLDAAALGRLEPVEVLYEYDGPRIFTAHSRLGELLCFLADDDGRTLRYIAAPTNPAILEKLKNGQRSLRDALDQPWVWLVDLGYDGTSVATWQGTLADVPSDALPQQGVMLWPHLEPILALRAVGEGLSEGNVPMSVIRQVIDGATTALKKIANLTFEEARNRGRKTSSIQQLYDLPVVGIAYNSFEVAFRLPSGRADMLEMAGMPDEATVAFEAIGKQLETALNWAARPQEAAEPLPIELLEALERLVPPQTGVVKSFELRGRMFADANARFTLTREASRGVRQALTKARGAQERISKVAGLVREFDKDSLSFTLRETDDGKDHVCRFAPELFDDLLEVFNTDQRVTISGRENLKTGEIDVSLVSS